MPLMQIKHRFTGEVIFQGDYATFRAMVEAAVGGRANLSRANLSGADLSGANLSGADLSGADLSGADLSGANLSGANLSGANLSRANLSRANLSGADLSGAYLSGANLSRANLSGADLSGANLSGANLSGAYGINRHLCTPLTILLDQPGDIRAYKLVTAEGDSPIAPNNGHKAIRYVVGKSYRIKKDDCNTNEFEQCGAGINLATLDWCMKEWTPGRRILIAEFTAKDIACIPTATDGKFRVFRCKIVDEKNLEEIGLVKPAEQTQGAK